jgi:hypothetical protein
MLSVLVTQKFSVRLTFEPVRHKENWYWSLSIGVVSFEYLSLIPFHNLQFGTRLTYREFSSRVRQPEEIEPCQSCCFGQSRRSSLSAD